MYLYVTVRIWTRCVEKLTENLGVPIGTLNVYCLFAEMRYEIAVFLLLFIKFL